MKYTLIVQMDEGCFVQMFDTKQEMLNEWQSMLERGYFEEELVCMIEGKNIYNEEIRDEINKQIDFHEIYKKKFNRELEIERERVIKLEKERVLKEIEERKKKWKKVLEDDTFNEINDIINELE